MQEDLINNPSHYAKHAVTVTYQPVDLCETCGFLLGNAFKYLFRYNDKGDPVQDLKKARYYLERHIRLMDNPDSEAVAVIPSPKLLKIFRDTWFIEIIVRRFEKALPISESGAIRLEKEAYTEILMEVNERIKQAEDNQAPVQ